MNRIIQYCLIGLWVSCSPSSTVDQKLPGKYVREKSDKYASFREELTIDKKGGQEENVFTVESITLTRRLDDNDKALPPQEEKESGTMIYDPQKKLLQRLPNGNVYSVDVEKGIITNGKVTFTKVDE